MHSLNARVASAATLLLSWFMIVAGVAADPPIERPKHPAAPAADRFITDREGRTLDLPAEDEMFTFVVFGDRTGGRCHQPHPDGTVNADCPKTSHA